MIKITVAFLVLFCTTCMYSQPIFENEKNLCLNLRLDRMYESFVIGVDNELDIVYAQDEKIVKEDINATFEHYKSKEKRQLEIIEKYGRFFIKPDSLGVVTLSVKTRDGIKEKRVKTKSLIAVGKLSRYTANHVGKINSGEFRAQAGIYAAVEGYDIDAKCNILNFEIIRISAENTSSRDMNYGGKFEIQSRKLVALAESGDLYIFRNIRYKCPGDNYEKRLIDMIFEIE